MRNYNENLSIKKYIYSILIHELDFNRITIELFEN